MRIFIDILLIFIYLDAAIMDFVAQGRSPLFVFLVALIVSTIDILLAYTLISETIKKILLDWLGFKQNRSNLTGKVISRWHNLSKYKYLTFFLLNLIPFGMLLTTTTSIAARFSHNRMFALLCILAGNTLKFMIFIPLYYHIL